MARKSIAVVALMLLIVVAHVQAAGPARHAVIVGINDYADAAIPDLKYAESDAKAVYDTLTDAKIGRFPKDNVTLLLGAQATNDNIKAALYGLRGAGKDDLVVIFYSGHGAKEGDEAFWVTQTAKRKALPATALPNTDIRKFFAKIPSQKMVVLLDCCYAASTVKKSLADPKKLFGEFEGKGRVTIAGSADNQEALEYEDKKAGVFTHYLVGGLRGAADVNTDGVVTFEEMWRYLGDNVRKASVKQGGLHEPVLISEGGLTPQFLLTFNPKVQAASLKSVQILRKLFAEDKITAAQFDLGRKALSAPALDAVAKARREVFADLVAGRISSKYLAGALKDAEKKAGVTAKPPVTPSGTKPTLAIAPFTVLGEVKVRDAGRILAERLLPQFSGRYEVIDQAQLARFLAQDNLSMSDLVELAGKPGTKGLAKAVHLRRVSYLVVGSVSGSPDGSLSITARICDWQTGIARANRYAQIGGENWKELLDRLPLLSGRLTGAIGSIGAGPEVVLPPLPDGVDALKARIMQLQAVSAQFAKARDTMTDVNPRIKFLGDKLAELHGPICKAIDTKLSELASTDAKLANLYKPSHPQRKALLDEVAYLKSSQSDALPQIASQIKAWGRVQMFLKLMSQAKSTLAKMPSDPKKLTEAQKAELRQARKAVVAALVYKPSDRGALTAKKRIEHYFTPAMVALWMKRAKEHAEKVRSLQYEHVEPYFTLSYFLAARKNFAAAKAMAKKIPDSNWLKIYAYSYVAGFEALAGRKDDSLTTVRLAKKIADGNTKSESFLLFSYSQLAKIQALAGDRKGASKMLVEEAPDNLYYSLLIVQTLAYIGDYESAKTAADRIRDSNYRRMSYITIAKGQAKAGDKNAARATFRLAVAAASTDTEVAGLCDVGKAQAEAGDKSGATVTFARVKALAQKSTIKDHLYSRVGQAQAKVGDIASARTTANQVQDGEKKAEILIELGRAQVKAGDKAGAIITLRSILPVIKKHNMKVMYLSQVGDALLEAGDESEALKTLWFAISASEASGKPARSFYGNIAVTFAKAGKIAEAKSIAAKLPTVSILRDLAFYRIASVRISAGDFTSAQAMLKEIESGTWRHKTCSEIANGFAKSGYIERLEEWYDKEKSPLFRYSISVGALSALLEEETRRVSNLMTGKEPLASFLKDAEKKIDAGTKPADTK